jgi:hypothetical protein
VNVLACSLAFVLLADAAPVEATNCHRRDHKCQAAKYTARAKAATTSAIRAKYLEAAHREFLALYDQTRGPEALCAARRSLDQTATVLGPVAAANQLAQLRQQLAEREAAARPKCTVTGSTSPTKEKKVARSTPRSPPPVVAKPTEPATVSEVRGGPSRAVATQTQPPLTPVVDTPTSTSGPVDLLAVPVRRDVPRPSFDSNTLDSAAPAGDTLDLAAPADPTARRLLIVGGVTLGVGVGLAAVAGYAGARLAHASRESFDLYAEHQGQGDAAALTQEDALRSDHARWLPVTVTTAALSGTAVIVGAVLVAIGKRRAAAATTRAALLPIPGGLAIHARF